MTRAAVLTAAALLAAVRFASAQIPHPVEPAEAAVIDAMIAREGIAAEVKPTPGHTSGKVSRELGALGLDASKLTFHTIASREKPKIALTFGILDHRVVAIRGNGPWVRNETLADFVNLPELRLLSVDHNGSVNPGKDNPFDGRGLDALTGSKLAVLEIGLGFADPGVEAAARIPGLRKLRVFHSKATAASLDALAGHPALRDFTIGEMAGNRVTETALAQIARIPRLERIGFLECFVTYDNGLGHLKPLAGQLKEIDLSMCLVSAADLARLKTDHPDATVLTSTPEEIAKRHAGVAKNLVRTSPPELAAPLQAALDAAGKK